METTPNDLSYKCLKFLLGISSVDVVAMLISALPVEKQQNKGEEQEVVKIEQFNEFINRFGPITPNKAKDSCLTKARTLLSQGYATLPLPE